MDSAFQSLSRNPPPGAATPDTAGEGEAGTEEPSECPPGERCAGRPARTGAFDVGEVPEASGAARSLRDPGVLWLVDDRPGRVELHAVRPDGSAVGRLTLAGAEAVNVEALAAGPCGAGGDAPCLYIADIGDNTRSRTDVRVLRVPEPDLAGGAPTAAAPDVISLRYPDEPHDAEALLVDAGGVPYVITKAPFDAASGVTGATKLFAAPGFRDGLLLDLGAVPLPEPEIAVATLFYGNTVTGADSAPGRVLLRTYDQAVEYVAPSPDADLAGFAAWPHQRVPAPWQPQAEAVAYAGDECGYYTLSEGSGDIWLVPCNDTKAGGGRAP